eukprot:scaffold5772_cov101-Cylindrotheca_fusiformis.AAC.3
MLPLTRVSSSVTSDIPLMRDSPGIQLHHLLRATSTCAILTTQYVLLDFSIFIVQYITVAFRHQTVLLKIFIQSDGEADPSTG